MSSVLYPLTKFSQEDQDLLKIIYGFSKTRKVKLYLVGGILRDLLLDREKENPDFDFTLRRGAINFARLLSRKMKAGFVILDEEHGACRIVKKSESKIYTFDFTDFRGKDLKDDLLHRDFTINAIALELDKAFQKENLDKSLIDPYAGRIDLNKKIIRVLYKNSFVDDPLRILRAFSFACLLGFEIEQKTLGMARKERKRLSQVSGERIREELFKIFATNTSFDCLAMLDKLKILEIIFPEFKKMRGIGQGPYHHLDVWQHTLETVKQLEILFEELKNNRKIQDYLNQVISSDRKRRALLKLGALLHDIGKPKSLRREDGKIIFHGHERIGLELTIGIVKLLKLSNDDLGALKKIVLCHLRPGYLADNEILTPRAKFRYFRDTDTEAVSVLLLSLADQRATKGPLTTKDSRARHEKTCRSLIKEYFKIQEEGKHERLINGDDLIKEFKLEPSVLIGKILAELEESQAIGSIKTRKEALEFAKRMIIKKKK